MSGSWENVGSEIVFRITTLEKRQEMLIEQIASINYNISKFTFSLELIEKTLKELQEVAAVEAKEAHEWRQQNKTTIMLLKLTMLTGALLATGVASQEIYGVILKLLL